MEAVRWVVTGARLPFIDLDDHKSYTPLDSPIFLVPFRVWDTRAYSSFGCYALILRHSMEKYTGASKVFTRHSARPRNLSIIPYCEYYRVCYISQYNMYLRIGLIREALFQSTCYGRPNLVLSHNFILSGLTKNIGAPNGYTSRYQPPRNCVAHRFDASLTQVKNIL